MFPTKTINYNTVPSTKKKKKITFRMVGQGSSIDSPNNLDYVCCNWLPLSVRYKSQGRHHLRQRTQMI